MMAEQIKDSQNNQQNNQQETKKDYKNTLNLPETDFPMKASLAEKEPLRLKDWASKQIFQQVRKARSDQKKYVLLDGPPYANGEIHIGHALNKILKDIVIKSKTLDGYDAALVPTWDCHGLPIELNIEKKYGKVGQKIDAQSFRAHCRDYVNSQVSVQKAAFERLGVIADWDHPSLTMDFSYEANIIRLLGKVIKNGHLMRGYKPVYWCLDCASSLAEAEVEYQNKTSQAIDVKFLAKNTQKILEIFNYSHPTHQSNYSESEKISAISAVIWTTTPWTLPANQGLCVGKNIEYVLVKSKASSGSGSNSQAFQSENFILAETLYEKVLARAGISEFEILGRCKGQDLEQQLFSHPFQERVVPVVMGDHVTTEDGTGIVHTAPAHGVEDFAVGKAYGLPIENPVGANGCYLPETPDLGGIFVRKADEMILKMLSDRGALLCLKPLEHSYPHCWRHKTPLIFRATSQWFISMTQNALRDKALAAIDTVNWVPQTGKARILSMIQDRPDWCISRQRTWGVPMPLFLHRETDELHPESLKILEEVAVAVEKGGIEAWFDHPSQFCKDEKYAPIPDTLDVWFDSGASSFCLLQHHNFLNFPADLYLEGSDQHRGWFQSSLLLSVASQGVAPYKEVLTHGFTVDEKGYKMSKSLGNVIPPQEIIKEFGADILRLWAASADYRMDMVVSQGLFKHLSDTYRRLRNTARFLLANLNGFSPSEHLVPAQDLLGLDQWLLIRAKDLQDEIIADYKTHHFHQVVQKIHYFCSVELGGFYLDVIKDRQYTCQKLSRARRSAQSAMFHVAHALVRWLAPILSFTADEIFSYLPPNLNSSQNPSQNSNISSLFIQTWWEFPEIKASKVSLESVQKLMTLRDEVNKVIEGLRAQGKLGSSLEAEVILELDLDWKKALEPFLKSGELRFGLIISKVSFLEEMDSPEILPGLKIQIQVSSQAKCERCWHRLESVGKSLDHPGLCERCVCNIAESSNGETREML
jgi:isoleucyl-tRNA synthetase